MTQEYNTTFDTFIVKHDMIWWNDDSDDDSQNQRTIQYKK